MKRAGIAKVVTLMMVIIACGLSLAAPRRDTTARAQEKQPIGGPRLRDG